MTGYKQLTVPPIPYLYVERSCSMDPGDIRAAMGTAFASVSDFLQRQRIKPTGAPMAVHYGDDPDRMTFRAGFPVARAVGARAAAPVRFDTTPGGEVLSFHHIGPYAGLRDSYGRMMRYMQRHGLEMAGYAWEVYLDDPEEVPEDALRTEIFVALKEDAVAHGRRRSGAL